MTMTEKKTHKVTLIPGDGIGNELCNSVKRIFEKALIPIDWDEIHVKNTQDFEKAIESIKITSSELDIEAKGGKSPFHQPTYSASKMKLRRSIVLWE